MTILGVSTRIVECLRVAQLVERHGELFLRRAFTSREIRFCSARARATQQYAAYWAGKEAVAELLGSSSLRWADIEIRREDAALRVALAGTARQKFEDLGLVDIQLAVSHCRTHATAYALAIGPSE